MTLAFLGLGSNLAGRRRHLDAALRLLAATPGVRILRVSGLYETAPWGKPDQPAFLNAVAEVESELPATGLLERLLEIEALLGRRRHEKWGPRTVDLDILLFGGERMETPRLTVPHPHLAERAFVLVPLAELAPDLAVPGVGVVRTLLDRLDLTDPEQKVERLAGPEWHPLAGAEGDVDRELLEELRRGGEAVSGQRLARHLGVSRTAVWKRLQTLQQQGYGIEARAGRGYSLKSRPDRLYPAEVQRGLATRWLGRRMIYRESVGSTNELARERARAGEPAGTIVVAEEQVGGRGRRGRGWLSPAGKGIWLSLLLRPALPPGKLGRLTLLAAVAVAEAVAGATGLRPGIKWPNDLLLAGRKFCGILLEMAGQPEAVEYVIAGIGLNVNLERADFPEELVPVATSLALELGRPVERVPLLQAILSRFEERYEEWALAGAGGEEDREDPLLRAWREWTVTLEREVEISGPGGRLVGVARDVAADGSLLLELPDGRTEKIYVGDVSLRPR